MTREQKINFLLERGPEDARRLALDEIDRVARSTNTFGSKGHREERDMAEKKYDDARRACEKLSDEELDNMVATAQGS